MSQTPGQWLPAQFCHFLALARELEVGEGGELLLFPFGGGLAVAATANDARGLWRVAAVTLQQQLWSRSSSGGPRLTALSPFGSLLGPFRLPSAFQLF